MTAGYRGGVLAGAAVGISVRRRSVARTERRVTRRRLFVVEGAQHRRRILPSLEVYRFTMMGPLAGPVAIVGPNGPSAPERMSFSLFCFGDCRGPLSIAARTSPTARQGPLSGPKQLVPGRATYADGETPLGWHALIDLARGPRRKASAGADLDPRTPPDACGLSRPGPLTLPRVSTIRRESLVVLSAHPRSSSHGTAPGPQMTDGRGPAMTRARVQGGLWDGQALEPDTVRHIRGDVVELFERGSYCWRSIVVAARTVSRSLIVTPRTGPRGRATRNLF